MVQMEKIYEEQENYIEEHQDMEWRTEKKGDGRIRTDREPAMNFSLIWKKKAVRYLAASILTLVFSLVYEHFSFGVTSAFLLSAFLFSLAGAVLCRALAKASFDPSWSSVFLTTGIAWLTIGALLQGMLAIYGTENALMMVYPAMGIFFLLLTVVSLIVH